MISPYKKPLLRIDLVLQIIFLIILFGGYGMSFLGIHIDALQDFSLFLILTIIALAFLGLINPVMNILHLILGNYSDETHKLRKNYTYAVLLYVIVGIIGFIVNLFFHGIFYKIGYMYLYGISHFFAIGYVYITILENKTQKIVDRRLYY